MSNDEILTDDYVAGLLSEEANDCSLKYSAMGMEAYRTNKKPANMLKPNTRFLRHIIKDTDNHNKALLAKEAAESKARLKDLEHAEEIKRRKTNPSTHDIRRRQMGDIHAILGGRKRRRNEDDGGPSSSKDSKHRETERRSERGNDTKDKDLFKDRRDDRRHLGRLSRGEDRHSKTDDKSKRSERSERSRREHRRRERSRSRGNSTDEEDQHRRSRQRRDRSRSPGHRRRSRSPRERKSRHRHRSPLEDSKDARKRKSEIEQDDSDALEDLIGPAPAPKYRGRGTVGASSGIDRRFSETYDPKTDIQMDDDEGGDNWDDAVETFRDRQKLRQNQEQRLRAAGFAEEQIQRGNGTDDKLADSVRWTKAGEKREWDVGKVVGADGVLPSEES